MSGAKPPCGGRDAGPGGDGSSGPEDIQSNDSTFDRAEDQSSIYPVSCVNCRRARQRCNRQPSCSRCVAQNLVCRYSSTARRGRKIGSKKSGPAIISLPYESLPSRVAWFLSTCKKTRWRRLFRDDQFLTHRSSKADTVEKLLSRIANSSVGDQVVTAIINSHRNDGSNSSAGLLQPGSITASDATVPAEGVGTEDERYNDTRQTRNSSTSEDSHGNREQGLHGSLVSPLETLAGAVMMNGSPLSRSAGVAHLSQPLSLDGHPWPGISNAGDTMATDYFARSSKLQTDWEALSAQPYGSTLKLDTKAHDPLAARLIDHSDVKLYFQRFLEIRNPYVGLIDSVIHTPEFVYGASFTLFSVICAWGCAVSTRTRDRLLYPALEAICEANIKWSIAASVRSLETIQAIYQFQYWAPMCKRQSDDPTWLRLSYALQLAKELRIDRPASIEEYVEQLSQGATADYKERFRRNFERTWLGTFIADKSFGIITGKSSCISWRQIPPSVGDWWRLPSTTPTDRLISSVADMRRLLVQVLEKRNSAKGAIASIILWYAESLKVLEVARDKHCTPDNQHPQSQLPFIALVMDHSILVLSVQALRALQGHNAPPVSNEVLTIAEKTVTTAARVISHAVSSFAADNLAGFHNTSLLLLCHAATEIVQVMHRDLLPKATIEPAAAQALAVARFMEQMVANGHATSIVHLYYRICRILAQQVEGLEKAASCEGGMAFSDAVASSADWLRNIQDSTFGCDYWDDGEALFDPQEVRIGMENINEMDSSLWSGMT